MYVSKNIRKCVLYVFMFVCMCTVCSYVCMYVCIYLTMHECGFKCYWFRFAHCMHICMFVNMYMHVYTVMWLYVRMYVCNELTWQLHVGWDIVWRGRYSYLLRSDSEATGSRKPSRGLRMYHQDSNECENHGHIRSGPSGEVLDRTRISWRSLSYRDRP